MNTPNEHAKQAGVNICYAMSGISTMPGSQQFIDICHDAIQTAIDLSLADKDREIERLKGDAVELHWMARRYADGRQTYSTGLFNEITRRLIGLGVPLNKTADKTVWARDGGGRQFDKLTPEEAAEGDAPSWLHNDLERRVELAEAQLARCREALIEIRNEHIASFREASEIGHSDGLWLKPSLREKVESALDSTEGPPLLREVIALLEWDGWKSPAHPDVIERIKDWPFSAGKSIWWEAPTGELCFASGVPKLTLDLCAEWEWKMTDAQRKEYREILCIVCLMAGGPIHATKEQRAEAMCRTLWPERFKEQS